MNAKHLDNLILLLSTDWFLPYWSILGIGARRERRVCLQEGFREIVKQIMSGAKEYWHINFSEERVSETDSMLRALLQKCGADRPLVEKIKALIRGEEITTIDEGAGWLVLSITERLFRRAIDESFQPSSVVREALGRAWAMVNRSDFPERDFEQLCLSSNSDWDVFVRNTTPDIPTRLADYVSAIASRDKFGQLWAAINGDLSLNERREVLEWFQKVSMSMTGEPLQLPREV